MMVAESYNRLPAEAREFDEPHGMLTRCRQMAERAVDDYPIALTFGVFALGLGLGAAIGASLARPLGFERQLTAETLGRRVLDSISDLVPAGVQRHLRG